MKQCKKCGTELTYNEGRFFNELCNKCDEEVENEKI